MKKILLAVTVLVYSLLAAISGNSQGTTVPAAVQNSFNDHFKNVQYARWVPIRNSYVVSFTEGQDFRDAYFTNDGEFKGIGRHITTDLLPMYVQTKLSDYSYNGYEIIELYQFDCVENGICFYASLQGPKNKLVLKMDSYGDISYSKKTKIKNNSAVNEQLAVERLTVSDATK